MENSIFDFNCYRDFLQKWIISSPKKGRGIKSKLSLFINCQTTYLSQVLSGKADFNFEQAEGTTRFLDLNKMEKKYFLMLVQFERAGTPEARSFLKTELKELKEQSQNLKDRFEVKDVLSEKEQERYYSHWLYSAVHVLSSIPAIKTKAHIVKTLAAPPERIKEVLDFLQLCGLVIIDMKNISIGPSKLHLASESHLVYHHHRNWRMQSMLAVDRALEKNLHYSSVVTLSKEDVFKIKDMLIESIKSVKTAISASVPEEECYSFNLDFFDLSR